MPGLAATSEPTGSDTHLRLAIQALRASIRVRLRAATSWISRHWRSIHSTSSPIK